MSQKKCLKKEEKNLISLVAPKPNNKKNTVDLESLPVDTDTCCHSSNPEERTLDSQHQQLANELNVALGPSGVSLETADSNNDDDVCTSEEPFQPKEFAFPVRRFGKETFT